MKSHKILPIALCGTFAGAINGLFGAGGGMILVPLLTWLTDFKEKEIFPTSVSIIAPLSVITLLTTTDVQSFSWISTIPYLTGSAIGGILAGILGRRIPTKFLHKLLGVLILWGGIRYLC